ncbi:MAG: hypothetical protein ACHP9Z_12030 [Streptosporangiales bacterium]
MRWIAFAAVLGVNIVDALDATIASIAGPSIHVDLGGGTNTVQWPSAGYTLTSQVRQLETAVGTALLRAGPDGRLTLTAHGQLFARDFRPALESLAQSRKSKDDNHGRLSRAPPGTVHLPGNQPAESCSTTTKHPAHGVQVHAIPTRIAGHPGLATSPGKGHRNDLHARCTVNGSAAFAVMTSARGVMNQPTRASKLTAAFSSLCLPAARPR